MGGRGGYSSDLSSRASSVIETMRGSGLSTVGQTESESIIRNLDNNRLGQVMYKSHLSDYERGFNKTANKFTKNGYKTEKDKLLKRISNNPSKIKQITERAQTRYKQQLSEIERQMHNVSTESEYQKLYRQMHNVYGKLQAANFINWSRK